MGERIFTVAKTVTDIFAAPAFSPAIDKKESQLLFGEEFLAESEKEGWLGGRSLTDGYAGFVRKDDLVPKTSEASHFVDVRLAHVYPGPDYKSRPTAVLSFFSRLRIDPRHGKNGFSALDGNGGWIWTSHIKTLKGIKPRPPLETALMLADTPYLYGGRSALGLDCSALVQLSVLRAGTACPRDSGDQEKLFGKKENKNPAAGDLVFFKGHVGIMADDRKIMNASARTMSARIEDLSEIEKAYGGFRAVGRPA